MKLPNSSNRIYQKLLHKTIAFQSVTIRNQQEFELHKALRCIDQNILLSQLPENAHCHPSEVMDVTPKLEKQFSRYSGILRNAEQLAARCSFKFDFTVPRNKKLYTGTKSGDMLLLGQLAKDGILRRYGRKEQSSPNSYGKGAQSYRRTQFYRILLDYLGYCQIQHE